MSHFLVAKQRKWLLEHGRQTADEGWVCKKTGAPINFKVHNYDLYSFSNGGPQFELPIHPQDEGGCTYPVRILWCVKCGEELMEKPILAIPDDIVEIAG